MKNENGSMAFFINSIIFRAYTQFYIFRKHCLNPSHTSQKLWKLLCCIFNKRNPSKGFNRGKYTQQRNPATKCAHRMVNDVNLRCGCEKLSFFQSFSGSLSIFFSLFSHLFQNILSSTVVLAFCCDRNKHVDIFTSKYFQNEWSVLCACSTWIKKVLNMFTKMKKIVIVLIWAGEYSKNTVLQKILAALRLRGFGQYLQALYS